MSASKDRDVPENVFALSYLPAITERSRLHYSKLDPDAREEAVQDCVCEAWIMYQSAARRGKASSASKEGAATPATLARYSNRSYDSGRRFCGSSSTDVMADGTRQTGRSTVHTLGRRKEDDEHDMAGVLADPRIDTQPLERVRVNHDYPFMIEMSPLSRRARQVWKCLLSDWGPGHVVRIAKRLKVSPGRVCQAKEELAKAFEAWDYRPRGWRRSGQGRYSPHV